MTTLAVPAIPRRIPVNGKSIKLTAVQQLV